MEKSTKTKVVSGSVWETRMINDEIMGGFKVFNEKKNPEKELSEKKQSVPKQRKIWKSDSSIQIAVKKSPNGKAKVGNEINPSGIRKLKQKRCDLGDDDNCGETEKMLVCKMKSGSLECEINPIEISDGIVEKECNLVKNGVLVELKKDLIGLKTEELGVKEVIGKIEKNKSDLGEKESVLSGLNNNVGVVKNVPKMENLSLNSDKKEEIEVKLEKESFQENKLQEQKGKQIINEEKKLNQNKEEQLQLQLPIILLSPVVKKQLPNLVNYSRTSQSPSKIKRVSDFDRFQSQNNQHRIPQTHGKLQSLIDLVMWRDVSKSTFVFGIGTFIIISSSYTKDLNISLISIFAYLGLVYLATIFIFRSILPRGAIDEDGTSEEYVVGEEEAVWLIKMVIPYLNECLIKIKSLFSGDPATTMKLGVLLFVLARTGNSITIWKMAKLGFFGVFTVPKICSSYSTQLTAYGKFWVRRFKDAWESCSHKKAVGFGIFTLVWNLSSVVARIWAVFMLFVAFRYYQQYSITNDCGVEEKSNCEPTWQRQVTRGRRNINVVTTSTKEKKMF